MTIFELLDVNYHPDGDEKLKEMLAKGVDPNEKSGPYSETALHVATRRRRSGALKILLDFGVDIDAKNYGGKTAIVHAMRRKFDEITEMLEARGADKTRTIADQLAVEVVNGRLDKAQKIIDAHPDAVRTGNPEEDRLLADVAGRTDSQPVQMLIDAGANLSAPALDDGTPLHQAAWFGQPQNAHLLIDAGAPLDIFDSVHETSPLGWAVHGSRYSGDAESRQDAYVALTKMLLEAGSSLFYPGDQSDAYQKRLLRDASPQVRKVLEKRFI